jgi:tetratricopeptide (TPR) repeat protein
VVTALPNLLLIALGCSPQGPDEPLPAETNAEVGPRVAAVEAPLVVVLEPPLVTGQFRWEAESAGLSTLLVEVGLSELAGVQVEVQGNPPPPGLERQVGAERVERWTGRLRLGLDPKALDLELELCTPDGARCRSTSATGTREAPERAVPPLLTFASEVLGRAPAAGTAGQWAIPVSADPYAVLVAGRASATWYGLLPAVPIEKEGEPYDNIAKAVRIDPSMALAQWLLARRYAQRSRWDRASMHFTAAREGRPFQPVFAADQATALRNEGKLGAAADTLDGLVQLAPRDPRFVLLHAETLLAAGRLEDARVAIDALQVDWPRDAGAAEARVKLADARGETAITDELLAHWADTDRSAVEPVRRQVQLRVRAGRFADAWEMLPELRRRGAHVLADGFEVPVGVALGRWDEAARAAERSGQASVAARIRARRDLEQRPDHVTEGLLTWDRSPEAQVVLARAALAVADFDAAVEHLDDALKDAPWDLDVLALAVDVNAARGWDASTQRYAERLVAMEPRDPVVVAGR